jgi:hypothetical protein
VLIIPTQGNTIGLTAAGNDHVKWTFGECFRQPDLSSGDLSCLTYGTVEFKNCTVQLPAEKQEGNPKQTSSHVQDGAQLNQDQGEAKDEDLDQSHSDKSRVIYINRLIGYPTSYK